MSLYLDRLHSAPLPVRVYNGFRASGKSGAIAATLAADSTLFSLRNTDASKLILVNRLEVAGIVAGTVTAGVDFDLAAFVARSFSASDTGGSAVTPSKLRSTLDASVIAAADLRVAGTAGLTAGTRTLDTSPLARVMGTTGTAVGTSFFGGKVPLIETNPGDLRLLLGQNEGLVITNAGTAGPITGTFNVMVNLEWLEIEAYPS